VGGREGVGGGGYGPGNRDQATENLGPWVWLGTHGNSMRRAGEIICKTAGGKFLGDELECLGCGMGVYRYQF
jgi:hypothetical protein